MFKYFVVFLFVIMRKYKRCYLSRKFLKRQFKEICFRQKLINFPIVSRLLAVTPTFPISNIRNVVTCSCHHDCN